MKKSKLPKTDSIQELADFWGSHELTDFEEELEEVAEPVFVRGTAFKVPLESRRIEAVERVAQARRTKGSSATDGHPAALDPDVLAAQCEFRATRRSGPGGQNRNKVETAVILTHRPTGISATASERRTQGENRRVALARLRLELALTIRRPIHRDPETPYVPTPLWQERCRGGRIVVNRHHNDFPALLAEALDVLQGSGDDAKAAARVLGCSPSQLIKLLKDAPRALNSINERRRETGRHPLR